MQNGAIAFALVLTLSYMVRMSEKDQLEFITDYLSELTGSEVDLKGRADYISGYFHSFFLLFRHFCPFSPPDNPGKYIEPPPRILTSTTSDTAASYQSLLSRSGLIVI